MVLREVRSSFFSSLHGNLVVILSYGFLSFMSLHDSLLSTFCQHDVEERETVSDMAKPFAGHSSSMSLFSILLHVRLHALDIFFRTCIMIVPVQFADVEVWISAAACLFPWSTESTMFGFESISNSAHCRRSP